MVDGSHVPVAVPLAGTSHGHRAADRFTSFGARRGSSLRANPSDPRSAEPLIGRARRSYEGGSRVKRMKYSQTAARMVPAAAPIRARTHQGRTRTSPACRARHGLRAVPLLRTRSYLTVQVNRRRTDRCGVREVHCRRWSKLRDAVHDIHRRDPGEILRHSEHCAPCPRVVLA